MNKPPLLFIKHIDFTARTVDYDLKILSEKYNITFKNINAVKGLNFYLALISQFFYLLFFIYRFKIVFIWFADYHSFLPILFSRIFRKTSILNIGGYDAASVLVEDADTLPKKLRKFCVKYSIKNATKLLAVSTMMEKNVLDYYPKADCKVVYCCIDPLLFENDISEKENLIITVGGGGKFIEEALRKRLDFFIELGNLFNEKYPEYNAKFCIIGHNENSNTYKYLLPFIKSKNVELKPMTKSINELNNYYKKASVYMQLSYWESFGIAQIEAMLNGCIPVSNDEGAVPEIVGDAGFLIKNFDKDIYIQKIKDILDKKYEPLRKKVKQRVLENFTFEIRKIKLNEILNNF